MFKRAYLRIKRFILRNLPFLFVAALIVTMLLVYLLPHIIIVIKSGEAGVLYKRFKGGTVTSQVYGEGIQLVLPWDKMTNYNARIQTIRHQLSVVTEKGMILNLTLVTRFKPEYDFLGIIHKTLGPDYANKIVIPEVESSLLHVLGEYEAEEIYTNKNTINRQVFEEVSRELGERYVVLDDVLIRKIELPPKVQGAIQTKIVEKHRYLSYEYILQREEEEKQRKKIESAGLSLFNKEVAQTLTPMTLKWKAVNATLALARSNNAKVVVIGAGENGLPLILGSDVIEKSTNATGPQNSEGLYPDQLDFQELPPSSIDEPGENAPLNNAPQNESSVTQETTSEQQRRGQNPVNPPQPRPESVPSPQQ